jgi:hypothetical protein
MAQLKDLIVTGPGRIVGNLHVGGYVSEGMSTTTNISAIPITAGSCKCTISANGELVFAATPEAGRTIYVLIYNSSSSAKTVTLRNANGYKSFSGTTLSVPATGYAEVSAFSDGSTIFIRAGY